MDLRAAYAKIRPWFLRASAVYRVGALLVASPLLIHSGPWAVLIALWLIGSAVGLWKRLVLPWRLALLGDMVLVIGTAVHYLEAENVPLFTTIALATMVDVILLGIGQPGLDRGIPAPQ